MSNKSSESLTYQDAGVSIDAGNTLVERIKPLAASTKTPGVLGNLGGFGALFSLPSGYKEPVLVSGTDGVGTKLKLAMDLGKHDTIGIDLVAMCVNDLIVCGAEPLFFLDYYATGKLDVDTATDVVSGIAEGCKQSECALTGGETAEMPGMYNGSDYDLAGFCVGVVEKEGIITGKDIKPGDKLIALASSGAHSNGYSLIRKICEHVNADFNQTLNDGRSLGEALLEPTRIYVKTIKGLLKSTHIKGVSHITGGGFTENLPRVLPEYVQANIDLSSWEFPEIFQWLQTNGNVEQQEMLRTFNCGAGLILVIDEALADETVTILKQLGEDAWIIGDIEKSEQQQPHVVYKN